MPLRPGDALGPYEITAVIGAGGMGEVYRARDTRLGRDVAIKILPPELAGNSDRLNRFLREARLASQLSHPNIVVLHDVGESGGIRYLAMEFVVGLTLREWMAAGRQPLSKRVDVAAQIAEGLSHAHKAGIVHRDMKPDNVIVSADGRAKILDFGIARSIDGTGGDAPTASLKQDTAQGVLIGTVPYMSPEQASGQTVDYRSDQFSLGTIVHELVTGRNPFAKASPVQTLSAIIEQDVPSIASADSAVPLPLAWIVARCLSKSPSERYESTGDLARDLKRLSTHISETGSTAAIAPRKTRVGMTAAAIAAVVALAVAATWFLLAQRAGANASDHPEFRQLTFRRGILQLARFTPDGGSIVFSGAWDGRPFEAGILRGARPEVERLSLPPAGVFAISKSGDIAVSRDCRWIVASQECAGTLAVGPLGQAQPRDLALNVTSADWTPDGKLAITRRDGATTLLECPPGNILHEGRGIQHVRVSPDGRLLAFSENGAGINTNTVRVISITGGDARILDDTLRFPNGLAWSADGSEIWYSADSGRRTFQVYGVSLDGRRRVVLSESQSLRLLDVARDGRILLASGNGRIDAWIRQNDRDASISWFGSTSVDGISPDGRLVLFSERGAASLLPSYSLYSRDVESGSVVFIGEGRGLAISADKKWVLASRTPAEAQDELVLYPTGVGSSRVIVKNVAIGAASFLPDWHGIMFGTSRPAPATFISDIDGAIPRRLDVPGAMTSPLAPDGERFVALLSDGSSAVVSLGRSVPPTRLALRQTEFVRQWTEDGRGLFVQDNAQFPDRVLTRLDLATGQRTLVTTIRPQDRAGIYSGFSLVEMTPDGRTIAYSTALNFGDLILATGVK